MSINALTFRQSVNRSEFLLFLNLVDLGFVRFPLGCEIIFLDLHSRILNGKNSRNAQISDIDDGLARYFRFAIDSESLLEFFFLLFFLGWFRYEWLNTRRTEQQMS